MTIFIPSIDPIAFPSLPTIEKTTHKLLDRWQQWSDKTFGGKYRDAAEILICGLILLVCCTSIRIYDYSKRCFGKALGYWLAAAEQQFLVESGLWLKQISFELLPVIECFNECWRELAQLAAAERQILDYELSFACAAME